HTQNDNHHTLAVCVEGNFTQRAMTQVERNNLYAAIITLTQLFNVPIQEVKGHGECYPTSCPGFDMNQVRRDVSNILLEMEYRKAAEYRIAAITDLAARVHTLHTMFAKKEQYWEDAERKLFTLYKLAEEYELMSP